MASDWRERLQEPEQPGPEHGGAPRQPQLGKRRGERLGRERRVRLARDFARIRHEGRSVSGPRLTLGYLQRTTPPGLPAGAETEPTAWSGGAQPTAPARVGFIVGKRVGGAVVRNRVRRRLREHMRRRFLPALQPGFDLVVIARPPAAAASGADLARDLETLLLRARMLAPAYERAP